MSALNNMYFRLPYVLQYILVNIFGLSISIKRYNKAFYRALNEYLEQDRNDRCNLDIRRIISLVEGSRFYRIKNESEFLNSPVLTKESIKKNYGRIVNKEHIYKYFYTSGTTGSGLKYPVSREFLAHQWAIFWKFRMIHKLTPRTWCAYMIGKNILNPEKRKGPFWIKSYPTYQLLFSVSHLNEQTIKMYLEKIRKSQIKWMHGYPSTLTYIATLIQECGLESLAKELQLDIITTSSETLYDFQKVRIEEIFACKVRQLYGLTEGVANIFECEHGSLHIDESFSYVEFMKEEGSCEDYKLIGTSYLNKAFPLIRYDTGDTVKLFENGRECPCGRKSRMVKEIIGREQDYLILNDGTKVGGSGFFFKKLTNVKRAQIYQRKKGEATFFIVKGTGYSEEEEHLLIEEIRNKLGDNFKFEIRYTREVFKLQNGKTKFVINEIENKCRMNYEQMLAESEVSNSKERSALQNDNIWKEGIH